MTINQSEPAATANQPIQETASYKFWPQIIESQGRSLGVVLSSRLCEGAKAKLSSDPLAMTYKELRKIFKDSCGTQEGYLSPQHPVLETVLRMLLTAKTDTLSLNHIHDQVSSLWLTSTWPRHINIDAMRRVLDSASAYGIIRS